MLVDVHLQALVDGVLRELVVVCEADDVVAERLIYVIGAIGAEVALVEYALNTSMGVEVCALPAMCSVEAAIWVLDVGAREWMWLRKVVDGAKTCANNNADGDQNYRHQRLECYAYNFCPIHTLLSRGCPARQPLFFILFFVALVVRVEIVWFVRLDELYHLVQSVGELCEVLLV